MFSNDQKEAYRSIHAPTALYEKVAEGKHPLRGKAVWPLGAVAACLALVVVLGLFLRPMGPEIVLNGQRLEDTIVFYDISPASDVRSSPLFCVPVELELNRKTEITVSHGYMTVDGGAPTTSLTVSDAVTVWWQIERGDVMPVCEMEICDSKGTTLVTLNYNNAEITATKKEN